MPDKMEQNLQLLLDGNALLDEQTDELCDFTLAEQNAAAEAKGIQPNFSNDFIPILGKTHTYVVACIIINDKNEVLMMQEAKQSCAGKWYLPAGRMESGETIVDAAMREVYEETGLNVEITTLLVVNSAGGSWYRFIVTGNVIGGELKTPTMADTESLQAKWILNLNELSLRSNDILPLIEIGRNYKMYQMHGQITWHQCILPVRKCHRKNYIRVIAVIKKRSTNKVHVLLSEKNTYHFPISELHPGKNLYATLHHFMIELFGAELPQHKPYGILSLEHSTSIDAQTTTTTTTNSLTTDGFCMTILVAFRPPLEEVALIGKCIWHELSINLADKLMTILSTKNSTISLRAVR